MLVVGEDYSEFLICIDPPFPPAFPLCVKKRKSEEGGGIPRLHGVSFWEQRNAAVVVRVLEGGRKVSHGGFCVVEIRNFPLAWSGCCRDPVDGAAWQLSGWKSSKSQHSIFGRFAMYYRS